MNWVFTDLVEKRRMKASLRSIPLAALRALIVSWDTRASGPSAAKQMRNDTASSAYAASYVMRETRHPINAEVAAAIMYLPE